ncbi:MAG: nuclear transport factor 2 family protein [Bacteroidota bacterium]
MEINKLPAAIRQMLDGQAAFDTMAFTAAFAVNAIVNDENQVYHGRKEIRQWNETSNAKYQTCFEVLDYIKMNDEHILTIRMSGNFPGSPLAVKFHITVNDDLIVLLKIF